MKTKLEESILKDAHYGKFEFATIGDTKDYSCCLNDNDKEHRYYERRIYVSCKYREIVLLVHGTLNSPNFDKWIHHDVIFISLYSTQAMQ